MTIRPLFSVLIANYNNGKYLMDAIESVRKQTYTNWEIILVDDASTDNSIELYKELEKDDHIHIYCNEENKGCGHTKRRCVELANGELCGFLDPDDALTENALEVMVLAHEKQQDVSMVYSRYYVCDANLNVHSISEHQCEIKTSFLEEQHGAISVFVAFKMEKYNQSEGISNSILRAVDHDLYLRLEEVGGSVFIDIPLYYYRKFTGNNISLGDNALKAIIWDCIIASDACRRRGMSVEKYAFPLLYERIDEEKQCAILIGQNIVRNSWAYRLGNFLLTPIKFIKSFKRK